jgi:hypothetical protein
VLTTEFLPPDRPLLAALMRSLPSRTGVDHRQPKTTWEVARSRLAAVGTVSIATVLTKCWCNPPAMNVIGFTGWDLPRSDLASDHLGLGGLPDHLTARNIGGLVYLVLISGITAHPRSRSGDCVCLARARSLS